MSNRPPVRLQLHQKSRELEIDYGNGDNHRLSCEFLRVHSPSAEVQGHGGQGGELPVGKALVNIARIEPVGHYAIRLVFNDGHDSGLYSWDYLADLCRNRDAYWQAYQDALSKQGGKRDPVVIWRE